MYRIISEWYDFYPFMAGYPKFILLGLRMDVWCHNQEG